MVCGFVAGQVQNCDSAASVSGRKPICLLAVNHSCTDTHTVTQIELSGINNPILHEESHHSDTVFMFIREIDGNKYRESSSVDSEGRSFCIKVINDVDTALFQVIDPYGDIQLKTIESSWFVKPVTLLDLPSDIQWTHIRLNKNDRNSYSFGRIMYTATKQLADYGVIVIPPDGHYRCLPEITSKTAKNLKYCSTVEGIALFVKPINPENRNNFNIVDSILSGISQKWSR